jgi:hypothetical protein
MTSRYRHRVAGWMVGHSENGELSLGGGLLKAQRCFGIK